MVNTSVRGIDNSSSETPRQSQNTTFKRLVEFDSVGWESLIRLRREMEESEKRCRISISEVVNTLLKQARPEQIHCDALELIRSELLKLWSQPERERTDFQKGFESALIHIMNGIERLYSLEAKK